MSVSTSSADQAIAPRSVRRRVALLVDAATRIKSAQIASTLDRAFDCSVHSTAKVLSANALGDAELAIWEPDLSEYGSPTDICKALNDFALACPLILIVGDGKGNGERWPLEALGAIEVADFMVRPFEYDELALRVRRLLASPSANEPPLLRGDSAGDHKLHNIIAGRSAVLMKEVDKLRRFAMCEAGVLILGETGTGKEVFAQSIHYLSSRAGAPMVTINCGAVPTELMESELFGHVKGAYTHAHASRAGLVREADGGTLFMDDVDCLPLAAQAKLLRFLQEREYRVVGSTAVQHADVRVIAASNQDLLSLVKQGKFRQDLFYRLNVLALHLPALRERKQDIEVLARHFLSRISHKYQRQVAGLSAAALNKLLAHDWPGNVRELEHVLERATLLAQGSLLSAHDIDLPAQASGDAAGASFQTMKAQVIESFERSYIETLLRNSGGNITDAARVAGKNRRALFELIRKHHILPASFRHLAQ